MGTAVNMNGIISRVAGEAITQYARVKLNASNQVIEADADDKGIGTAQIDADNLEHVSVKLWSAPGTHKVIATGAFTINDVIYGTDNGEVDDDPDFGVAVGRASETTTASGDIIEMIPLMDEGNGLIFTARADSAAITNTTTPTNFDKTKTIDGAELEIGDVIEVIARVHLVSTNATDTLDLNLLFGTESIVTTGAVDVVDNDVGVIHAWITIRTLGASGTISATAETALGVSGTAAMLPKRKDEAVEDISGNVLIAVEATWSVANAGNQVILEDLVVIKHRQ